MTQAPTPGPLSGKRYRKKPVVIEAIQWTGDNLRSVITFTDGPPDTRSHHASMKWEDYADLVARDGLRIFTREDGPDAQVKHYASVGDFIIRGVQGELYACKPDIFAATYEPESLAPTAPVEASGSERGQAGAVMDALWPLLGGNHTSAELWTEIDAAVSEALRPQPSGFIATLTDDQRAAALAHTGDDTHPQPSGETRPISIDDLAQEIRRVDGSHSLGAGALAEALMPFLSARPLALGGQS